MIIEINENSFINIYNICYIHGKAKNRNPISSTKQFVWVFYCMDGGYPRESKKFINEEEAKKWLKDNIIDN